MYRVLHIIDSLGYGGTEHQLVLNVPGLQGEQFQNYVCYLRCPNDLELHLSGLGIPVYSLALTGRFQWNKGVARLWKLVKSLNVDLMHTNLFEANLLGRSR